jgi:hypothetical protein
LPTPPLLLATAITLGRVAFPLFADVDSGDFITVVLVVLALQVMPQIL